MPIKNTQSDLFKKEFAKKPDRFGGNRRTTRASRKFRPVSTKTSMHLILKSLLAKGAWSFLTPRNKRIVKAVLKDQAEKHGVQILSSANVGNHLHIHLKVRSNLAYKAFVRATAGAIALKITGASKLNKLKARFWTQSPYTRFVHGIQDYMRLSDYIEINEIEGFGYSRKGAELFIRGAVATRQKFRAAAGLG